MSMEACMFCLEESDQEIVISLEFKDYYSETTCECRMHTHVACWMTYLSHKGRPECPICHRVYEGHVQTSQEYIIIQNPMVTIVQSEQQRSCEWEVKKKFVIFLSAILLLCAILLIMRH